MSDVRVVVASADLIGESPVWDAREQALYWVDVEGRRVQRWQANTNVVTGIPMPEPTGCIGLREGGGLIAAMRTGFVSIDRAGAVTALVDPEAHLPDNRFNDGKVDRAGRFWAGTKNIANTPSPTGSVYRLDADLTAHRIVSDISCTNGIAWSPDNRTMYLCDTWVRRIYTYRFDQETGCAHERALFAEIAPDDGFPDGLTVDREGFVWSAHYNGWRITRYAPNGSVDHVLRLPVQHVTSLTFGGADWRTLFITTARMRIPEQDLAAQPFAGHVLAIEPGITGLPEPYFAG
ncbi:MAG: SMP-30/gluconolactonase/LRE family protein [Betaproteobacteria bacterium]